MKDDNRLCTCDESSRCGRAKDDMNSKRVCIKRFDAASRKVNRMLWNIEEKRKAGTAKQNDS